MVVPSVRMRQLTYFGLGFLALAGALGLWPVESATILGSHASCGTPIAVVSARGQLDQTTRDLCLPAAQPRVELAGGAGAIGVGLLLASAVGAVSAANKPAQRRAEPKAGFVAPTVVYGPGWLPAGTRDDSRGVWETLSRPGGVLAPGTYVVRQPVQIRSQERAEPHRPNE